jgi:hypothetical protein
MALETKSATKSAAAKSTGDKSDVRKTRLPVPQLPDWLTRTDKGVFEIDPDIAYPAILEELGVAKKDIDQYWIEVAYQCAKLEVQRIITGTEADPRPQQPLLLTIISDGGRKDRWAHASHPEGRGVDAASKGREAIAHYRNWRGFIPG